jgi:hypothetical protein
MEKKETHEQLQARIFVWTWNEHPELRYLCFRTMNNLTTQIADQRKARQVMAIQKSMGMVKGTTDLVFYYAGVLYGFDIKVGNDRLKPEQKEFISAIEAQGGCGGEIRSFEQWVSTIEDIIHGRYNKTR